MLFVLDSGGVPSISRMVQVLGPSDDPGRVPVTLTVGKAAVPQGDLSLQWGMSCSAGAADYGIYQGTIGGWYSHTLLDCNDDGSSLAEQITPAAGSSYYLVVPHNASGEGSYGRCSPSVCLAGDERPVGSAQCVVPQVLTSCP